MSTQNHAKARRGDLAVIPYDRSVTYQGLRGTERQKVFRLVVVTSVSRDGFVKCADRIWPSGSRSEVPKREVERVDGTLVSPADKFDRPLADVLKRLEYEYSSLDAARAALSHFVKKPKRQR